MVRWARLDWERVVSEDDRWWLLMLLLLLLPLDRKALALAVVVQLTEQIVVPLFEIDDDYYRW